MKTLLKLIALLTVASFVFSKCCEDENTTYTLKYVVFYPGYQDTVIVSNHCGYFFGSDRGTNFIKDGRSPTNPKNIYNNSAPYKILFYRKLNNQIK